MGWLYHLNAGITHGLEGFLETAEMCIRDSRRNGADDVLDVVDGVGHTGVLGNALVVKVDLAVLVQGHVLQQSVALDGVVDIRLRVLVQVEMCIRDRCWACPWPGRWSGLLCGPWSLPGQCRLPWCCLGGPCWRRPCCGWEMCIRDRENDVKIRRQPGCWLRSSHSFKECVIAHWSSVFARII